MTTWYILLSFVQVHVLLNNGKAEEINLIQSIKTEVSTLMSSKSNFETSLTSWDGNNSIDNKAIGDPNTCGCCAGTSDSEPPWLQIDLGSVYTIRKIQITGRSDNSSTEQFQNIYVYASNISMILSNGSLVYHGNPTTHIMFKLLQQPAISFRYLMIRRFHASYLTVCEVELFEAGTNLLDHIRDEVSTNQSSIFQGNGNLYGPSNAIDGKPNYAIDTCQCCSVTNPGRHSWWQIDLKSMYSIDGLEIFGRNDINVYHNVQLQEAKIFAGNLSLDTDMNQGTLLYTVPRINKTTHFIHQLNETVTAQFLIITLQTHILTLCEFIVYGTALKCEVGLFGKTCLQKCHCADKRTCNGWTGKCKTSGCLPGWKGQACDKECTDSKFGPNCANLCHCSNNSQCDIFYGNCSNDCDVGWAGFNCSLDLNILRRNTTSATSLQSRMYSTCRADRAIDGIDAPVNASNDADLCAACSVAQNDNNVQFSWWQLDFGSLFLVKSIKIFGRPNIEIQSQNITGYINNISMEINQLGMMLPINSSKGYIFMKDLMEARLFRYLKIQKQDTVLTLCEVKLYEAECPVGTFGDRCSNPCKCADKLDCDKVKGTCMSKGCLSGWEGAACKKSCGHQHFGPDCKYKCHCFSNGSCPKDSGICNTSRCDPGWELSNCSKACSYPHFGDNCRDTCHCLNNSECDHRDGKCDIRLCEAGWQGESCNNVCDHRRFGINCSSVCNCRDNTSCNATTGQCNTGLCDPGWLGNRCDKVCDHRRFGINCSSECNCRDNASCDAITGHCKTGLCDPGWLGLSCDKGGNLIERIKYQVSTQMSSEAQSTNSTFAVDGHLGPDPDKCHCCSITYNAPLSWWLLDLGKRYPLKSIIIYGRNKEDSYQQLTGFKLLLLNYTIDDKPDIFLSNDFLHTVGVNSYEQTLNNALARYIKIERPGVLTLCEVIVIEGNCRDGTFGEECVQDCHCADNKPCQTIHGYCQSPICKLGWMGRSCNESCTKNTFGEECKHVCYCEEDTCTSDYGICPSKCRYGYRGVHCNIEGIEEAKEADHSSSVVIGGSVAGGVVVIGILLLLVVLIYKQRIQRVKRNESENYYKTIHRNMAEVDDETTYDTIDITHDNQDQQNEDDNVRVTGL